MEQISKAKAEIQMARRSLQMVSKQVGGGVTKTEHAAAELGDEDGLEQDLEEQSLLKKAQTLPEQSAALSSQVEPIAIQTRRMGPKQSGNNPWNRLDILQFHPKELRTLAQCDFRRR